MRWWGISLTVGLLGVYRINLTISLCLVPSSAALHWKDVHAGRMSSH